MATEKSAVWSGFWPRLFAYIIDSLVLAVVCYGIGWAAVDTVSSWGSNGRFIGLILGVLYFGVTASGLGGGRSIGMRLVGLKVTGLNGRPLGLFAALARALLLVGPMMLNGWTFTVQDPTLASILTGVAVVAVFGVSLAQIYLLLFNAPTRRLVHDLVFGSVVVRAQAKDYEVPKAGAHGIVAGVIVVASLGLAVAGPVLMQSWMPKITAMVGPQMRVVTAVEALPEVSEAGVEENTSYVYGTSGPPEVTRTLIVTARVRKWPADENQELARIGAVAVKSYHFAPGERLLVKLLYGYDTGFASYSYTQADTFSTQCTTADIKCLAP